MYLHWMEVGMHSTANIILSLSLSVDGQSDFLISQACLYSTRFIGGGRIGQVCIEYFN